MYIADQTFINEWAKSYPRERSEIERSAGPPLRFDFELNLLTVKYEDIDNCLVGLKKSSKKNASKSAHGDEFLDEVDELMNWVDENQTKPIVIRGNDISSALTKFSKVEIVRLGESMLSLENDKKVLKSWADSQNPKPPQRLTDYLGEISKAHELSNISECEIVAITFMSDCYIEYREKWNDPDKEFTAEELLNRLIQKSLERDEFAPDLFQWGFNVLIGSYETIFPIGYKNHSERMESSWSSHYSELMETKDATLNRLRAEQDFARDLDSRFTDNS